MPDAKNISPEEGLRIFLQSRGVPERALKKAIANCERIAAKARLKAKAEIVAAGITRPKWVDRSGELQKLNAPQFLRTVYPDAFRNGILVDEDLVRVSDAKLVKSVQQYVCERKSRNVDPGDAVGIAFTPNKYGQGGFKGTGLRKRKQLGVEPK
jgi:hypothetical protein